MAEFDFDAYERLAYKNLLKKATNVTHHINKYGLALDPFQVIAGGFASYLAGVKPTFSDFDIFEYKHKKNIVVSQNKFTWSKGYGGYHTPYIPHIYLEGREKPVSSCTLQFPLPEPIPESGYWIAGTYTDHRRRVGNSMRRVRHPKQYVYIYSVYMKKLVCLDMMIEMQWINGKISIANYHKMRNTLRIAFGFYITKHFDVSASQFFITQLMDNEYYLFDCRDQVSVKDIKIDAYKDSKWSSKWVSFFKIRQLKIPHQLSHDIYEETETYVYYEDYMARITITDLFEACIRINGSGAFSKSFIDLITTKKSDIIRNAARIGYNASEKDIIDRIFLTLFRNIFKYKDVNNSKDMESLESKCLNKCIYTMVDNIHDYYNSKF